MAADVRSSSRTSNAMLFWRRDGAYDLRVYASGPKPLGLPGPPRSSISDGGLTVARVCTAVLVYVGGALLCVALRHIRGIGGVQNGICNAT
jgi:hypothetical protein